MTNTKLKAARVMKSLTQLELAQCLSLPEIEISRIETGRKAPDKETQRRIAEVLGRGPAELFD